MDGKNVHTTLTYQQIMSCIPSVYSHAHMRTGHHTWERTYFCVCSSLMFAAYHTMLLICLKSFFFPLKMWMDSTHTWNKLISSMVRVLTITNNFLPITCPLEEKTTPCLMVLQKLLCSHIYNLTKDFCMPLLFTLQFCPVTTITVYLMPWPFF